VEYGNVSVEYEIIGTIGNRYRYGMGGYLSFLTRDLGLPGVLGSVELPASTQGLSVWNLPIGFGNSLRSVDKL